VLSLPHPHRVAAAARGRAVHCRRAAHCVPDGPGGPAAAPGPGRRTVVPGKPAVPGSAARRRGSPGRRGVVNQLELLTSPAADLEVWLLLGYALTVLAGARLTEALARTHFRRARRYAELGFHYDADADHYHCPHGERLSLHVIDSDQQVAVYRAPASRCAVC